MVPKLSELSEKVKLGVDDGKVSQMNAALAVQLSTSFLKQKFPEKLQLLEQSTYKIPFSQSCRALSPAHIKGLETTRWPGRFQVTDKYILRLYCAISFIYTSKSWLVLQRIIKSDFLHYFLDGAHTEASLAIALDWFANTSERSSFRVLIFNVTGERGSDLVVPFALSNVFRLAIFCPVLRRGTTPDRGN